MKFFPIKRESYVLHKILEYQYSLSGIPISRNPLDESGGFLPIRRCKISLRTL